MNATKCVAAMDADTIGEIYLDHAEDESGCLILRHEERVWSWKCVLRWRDGRD